MSSGVSKNDWNRFVCYSEWTTLQIPGLKRCNSTCSNSREKFEVFIKTLKSGKVTLIKDEKSGIAVVTLENKNKKNAVSGSMMCDLKDIVGDLQAWQNGKGVILRGHGGTFCSGGDLETVKNIQTNELGYEMSCLMGKTMQQFADLPMISVAMVDGNALGGGAELAVQCDFIVMCESARLGFVQARMGVITGWGGGTHLVRKLGRSRALDILASARVMDAIECKRLGLVNEIFPKSENMLDLTKAWMEQFCRADVQVLMNLKSMTVAACSLSLEDSKMAERKLFSELWGSKANIDAFNRNIKH